MLLDTTVINNFLQAGRVDLLQQIQIHMCACPAVLEEIQVGIHGGKVPQGPLDWLSVVNLSVDENAYAIRLRNRLGKGESESIAVALMRRWQLATDDRDARLIARQLQISTTGTIGILALCTRNHIVNLEQANEILMRMVSAGYYAPVSRLDDLVR